jgi:hypothetical protein
MSDLPAEPYSPVTAMPYHQPDPQRVGLTRLEPFEHFCAVCGAHGPFGFGGDFSAGVPGIYACLPHRAEVERRWKRG